MKTLSLLVGVLVLAACSDSTASIKSAEPCDKPVLIPDRWLTDRDVENLWTRDRHALLDCADKVETLSGREITPTQR